MPRAARLRLVQKRQGVPCADERSVRPLGYATFRRVDRPDPSPMILMGAAVFGLGFVEIWFAVPTGFALGLAPLLVWALTVAGSLAAVTVVALGGDRLRTWLTRGRRGWMAARTGRIYGIWVRYGVPGWGLASPLLVAPAMGTAIGLLLGAPPRRLLTWMAAGVLVWTSILTIGWLIGVRLLGGG